MTVYKSISKELNGINQSDTCDVTKKCVRETAISKGHIMRKRGWIILLIYRFRVVINGYPVTRNESAVPVGRGHIFWVFKSH